MAAWTLPSDGPLTDAQRREAMRNFHQYAARCGIRIAEVARQVGKPKTTTIGDLIKGIYTEHSDAHIRKLNNWIEQHARQKAVTLDDPYVETRVAMEILQVARLVRENQTMGLIVGPTGIGKTRCAQAIHDTFVGSIYVTLMFGAYHPKGLTRALAEELGVRTAPTSRTEQQHLSQLERVVARLRKSNRLIIIDEAHKARDGAIELLREIHDATGVPILLLAVQDLKDRIEASADPDHGQLYSRFEITHPLTEGRDVGTGGKPLYSVKDIRALYQMPPIRLSSDAARYLQDVANDLGHGSLRRCKTLLRNAARRARKRQGLDVEDTVTVTADDLAYTEAVLKRSIADQEQAAMRRRRATATA